MKCTKCNYPDRLLDRDAIERRLRDGLVEAERAETMKYAVGFLKAVIAGAADDLTGVCWYCRTSSALKEETHAG